VARGLLGGGDRRIDVERDVLAQMQFKPRVAEGLRTIDPRVYADGPMGMAAGL